MGAFGRAGADRQRRFLTHSPSLDHRRQRHETNEPLIAGKGAGPAPFLDLSGFVFGADADCNEPCVSPQTRPKAHICDFSKYSNHNNLFCLFGVEILVANSHGMPSYLYKDGRISNRELSHIHRELWSEY